MEASKLPGIVTGNSLAGKGNVKTILLRCSHMSAPLCYHPGVILILISIIIIIITIIIIVIILI